MHFIDNFITCLLRQGNNVVWKEADTIVVIKTKKITKSNGEIKKWYKIKLYGETARDPSFWITSDSTWTVGTNLYLASKK